MPTTAHHDTRRSAAANTWAAATAAGTSRSNAKSKPSTARSAIKTFTGPSIDIRWGPVQVQLVVQGKTIIDIRATAPAERSRSACSNDQALPLLKSQVLTMTSEAYSGSLQAALDLAHLQAAAPLAVLLRGCPHSGRPVPSCASRRSNSGEPPLMTGSPATSAGAVPCPWCSGPGAAVNAPERA